MKLPARLQGLTPGAARSIVATAQALEAGRPDEAARFLAGALASHPDHPEALRLEAGLLSLRGQPAQAVATMRRAVALRPDDALYHNTLGSVLADAGDFDGAIVALRRACELQPTFAGAWYNLGIVLTRCVRYEQAVQALQRAVQLDPRHAQARAQLADALKGSGHIEQAVALYRALLVEQPWAGMAWWGLANIKTVRMQATDAEAIARAIADIRANDDDRIASGFALARVLDEQGHFAQALQALAQANAIARRRVQWNAAGFSATMVAIESAFNAVGGASDRALGREAIFVVGLPRSGTTLVEQILASHSHVAGAGELPDLPLLVNAESARRGQPFPQWVGALRADEWADLGRQYLQRTAHWRSARPIAIDKLPNNWIYIAAIRAMLPGARIVVCRRDRLETCFSCYRQHFAGNDYTRTFEDLGAYWHAFDACMRRHVQRDPEYVHEHVYEQLIADPEHEIRALLEFCDLPFEPGCLRFHETPRAVHSPSAAQVRQPLRADTAHAPRYGALLDPLRRALGMPPFADGDHGR